MDSVLGESGSTPANFSGTRGPHRERKNILNDSIPSGSPRSPTDTNHIILPVHERVFERQRQQELALLQEEEKQGQEQVEPLASGEPHLSRASSVFFDERNSMAHRGREPFVILPVLERMRQVFDLHEWRTQRKRQALLCFMSPCGSGDEIQGSSEDDIAAMLKFKQKQAEMEMRLRVAHVEGADNSRSGLRVDLSAATAPNPGIPFSVFERDIVEPFFDSLFPPSEGASPKSLSKLIQQDSAAFSQGLATQITKIPSFFARSTRRLSRGPQSQKSLYQRRRASHVEAAENLFRLIDTNVDGFVSWDELSSYILQSGQRHLVEDSFLQSPSTPSKNPSGGKTSIGGSEAAAVRMLAFAPLPTNTNVWQKQYPLVRFLLHSQPIRKILVSNRGRRYVTFAWDGLVKLWRHDPCLTDAKGKPSIVHERNLFAAGSPIIDAALSPESFGNSEVAVVVAMDGSVTLLRVSTGEVLKTFMGRCTVPPRTPYRCFSSGKKKIRHTCQKEGAIDGTVVSRDICSSPDNAVAVLRPTYKVKAYRREAIDIFFTDVSRYFSGLGVVAPTYEHLERRRTVKADILKDFGGTGGLLGEGFCGERSFGETQERFGASDGGLSPTLSTENVRNNRYNSPTRSISSRCSSRNSCDTRNVSDHNPHRGEHSDVNETYTVRGSDDISSIGKKRRTTKGNANEIGSAPTKEESVVMACSGETETQQKSVTFSYLNNGSTLSPFQQTCGEDNDEQRKQKSPRFFKNRSHLESETCWFARSAAFARHDPTSSSSRLAAGSYLLLGFETGVLQLYPMRPHWFTISNLCSTRVEPQATHAPVVTISLHRAAITHILFHERSGLLMTGSDDATVVVRHIGRIHVPFVTLGNGVPLSGTIPSHTHGHTRRITCMCYDPTRGILVTGGMDRYVFPWLPSTPRPMHRIDLRALASNTNRHTGHPIDVSFMQPPHQPLLLLVLDSRRTIFIFDVVAFHCLHIMCDDSPGSLAGGPLLRVRYDAVDDRLVLAGKYLRIWDTARDEKYSHDYHGHRRPLVALAFQHYWRFWISADDAIVNIWKGEITGYTGRRYVASFSMKSGADAGGCALNITSLRSWRVESGISSMTVDQTESAHIFVALLRERRIAEYNIFTGSVLRTFSFPANVGEITSLACCPAVQGAPPPAMYQRASPFSFICAAFERDQSKDGTTGLYSLSTDSGSVGNGMHRRIVTSRVGVSSAVIIASLGLVVIGHRGGISASPFDETTTCPIVCLRLTDKHPKDKSSSATIQKNTNTAFSGAPGNVKNSTSHINNSTVMRKYSVKLPSPGASSSLEQQQPCSSPRNSDASLSCDAGGHCRRHPPLDLVALFPGPLVHDPVAITREYMLHREPYLFHDEKTGSSISAAPSEDTTNKTTDGGNNYTSNNNNNKNNNTMNQEPNNAPTMMAPPLLLFSEEFTAKASMVGSSFGVFAREQLSSLGYVLHIAPVANTGYIATGSDDGLLQFWNLRTLTEVMRFRTTYTIDTVTAIDVCPAASYTAIGDASGYVLLLHIGRVAWDFGGPLEMVKNIENNVRVRCRWRGHEQGVTSVRFVSSPPQQSRSHSTHTAQLHPRQRSKKISALPTSPTASTTTMMTAIGPRNAQNGSQTVSQNSKPVVDDRAPVFLCTSSEDTYIFAWCWQQKQQQQQQQQQQQPQYLQHPNDMDSGEIHCIGCFGAGKETPPVPPLGKWTENAWRVLDAVRRLYVSERLMPLFGALGVRGLPTEKRDQKITIALERAAAFVMEDMRHVRATSMSLPQTPLPIGARSHGGGDSYRGFSYNAFRNAACRNGTLPPTSEFAPTFVFAFEEGTYYDRNLVELIERTVEEITGRKLRRPAPEEEPTESKDKKNTQAPPLPPLPTEAAAAVTTPTKATNPVTPTEEGNSPSRSQGHKVTPTPLQESVSVARQLFPQVTGSAMSTPSEMLAASAQFANTLPMEHSSFSVLPHLSRVPSIMTLRHSINPMNEDAGVLRNEMNPDRSDALITDQSGRLHLPAFQKNLEDSYVNQNCMSLPQVGSGLLDHVKQPLSVESFSPNGRESASKRLFLDQLPPVAVSYDVATPLPRLRQPNVMEQGIAGADVLQQCKDSPEERLPLLSYITPRRGSAKARDMVSAEKVLVKEKPRRGVFSSKLFEEYIHAPVDRVEQATTSADRHEARRELKRVTMLWTPERVMNTLMTWKAPIVEPLSTTGLRRRRAPDAALFCDTDDTEISLPLYIPLVLGCDIVPGRPGSGPLVVRHQSVVGLEAEVGRMKEMLHAAMLEKQQLVAQERVASAHSQTQA